MRYTVSYTAEGQFLSARGEPLPKIPEMIAAEAFEDKQHAINRAKELVIFDARNVMVMVERDDGADPVTICTWRELRRQLGLPRSDE